jgi:AcrR family transcriptional regulator
VVESEIQEAEESRREVILKAALGEFNEHGYAATSIQDIRRRSGASVGSIYHHFEGKQRLAETLYVDGLRGYQWGFVETLRAAGSTREGVERVVHHHAAWIELNQDIARFLLLAGHPPVGVAVRALRRLNRSFFAAIGDWTGPRVAAGELLGLELEVMAALWIGPSQELARHWLAGRSRTSPTNAAPALAEAAWRSLCA